MLNKDIEKYAIYSSGFRGLPDGWHNLKSFNFLVGENSTGKSSFLQLIEIMDSQQHQVFFDVCGIVPGIDTAFDVISRMGGKSETTIGYLIERKAEEESNKSLHEPSIFGRLATYERINEDIHLLKLSIISDKKIVSLKRTMSSISHRFDEYAYENDKSHTENGKNFEKVHFLKNKRFKPQKNMVRENSNDMAKWMNALVEVASETNDRGNYRFFNFRSPLNCVQYGPLRGKPRRLHHGIKNDFSPTGEHFPFLVRDALKGDSGLFSAIEKFGKESRLFDKISVASVKTAINDKPFAIQIEKSGSHFYLDELGFGVGQILPIVADIAISSKIISFLIQQPELHLHPRAQASLGDVFWQAAKDGRMLVVETHSDFIIDRFRLRHKQSLEKPSAQIIYFEKDKGGNKSFEIEIMSDGTLENVPHGYRDFFVSEIIDQFENF